MRPPPEAFSEPTYKILPPRAVKAFYIFPFLYRQRCQFMRDLYTFPIYKMDEDESEETDEDEDFDEDWEDEEED